ncbi:MAG: hypothetical protein FWF78_07810 [Defluviitaleaceae bacterium]|nr:hypothetical protein [Defluviitaleaceae bacterium]
MDKDKIVLPEKLQKEILKFFLKTSIPRIAREKEKNKALPDEGREKT